MPFAIDEYLRRERRRVNRELDTLLPPAETPPAELHAAMRHSVFAGGKRIRPILAIAAAEACGRPLESVAAPCALECVHTYSLIHDDLPALDDDRLRRGKPTCHVAFGESTAILAGDALLTRAFGILADLGEPARVRAALVGELAAAAGTLDGMIGGQVADLAGEGGDPTGEQVEYIHRAKTAALIRASVRFGGLCARAGSADCAALGAYGARIGLAFQIVDDILDVVSSSEVLGKTAGKDESRSKATYPAVYGIEESRRRARRCLADALGALERFGSRAEALRSLGRLIVRRSN